MTRSSRAARARASSPGGEVVDLEPRVRGVQEGGAPLRGLGRDAVRPQRVGDEQRPLGEHRRHLGAGQPAARRQALDLVQQADHRQVVVREVPVPGSPDDRAQSAPFRPAGEGAEPVALALVEPGQDGVDQFVLVPEVVREDARGVPERLRQRAHGQAGEAVLGQVLDDRVQQLGTALGVARPGHARCSSGGSVGWSVAAPVAGEPGGARSHPRPARGRPEALARAVAARAERRERRR